jgi:hypothetical protein
MIYLYLMAVKEVNTESRIFKKLDNLSSKIDNEVVILNVDKGEYNGLDEIGSDIWRQLESPMILSDLIAKLVEKYNVDQHQCTLDVIDFITELEKAGLINIENEIK